MVAGLDLEAQGGYLAKDRAEKEGGGRKRQTSVRLKLSGDSTSSCPIPSAAGLAQLRQFPLRPKHTVTILG